MDIRMHRRPVPQSHDPLSVVPNGRQARRLVAAMVAGFALFTSPAHAIELSQRPNLVNVDIATAPWSAVGRINNSAYGRCSAILVRPDLVLTAAHCLYNKASRRFLQPASIHVLFGFSKGKYGFHTTAAEITIGADYVPGLPASAPHDWALVRLAKAAPEAYVPMVPAEPGDAAPKSVRAAGFGRERSEVLTAIGPCPVLSPPGRPLVVTDCGLSHGFSGGPMIDASTGRLVTVSVAVGEHEGRALGFAVPVSLDMIGRPAKGSAVEDGGAADTVSGQP